MSNRYLEKIVFTTISIFVISLTLVTSSVHAASADSFEGKVLNNLFTVQPHTPLQSTVVYDNQESNRHTGVVMWFNPSKGYGFIKDEDGTYIFVHYSNIRRNGYQTLKAGQTVEFEIKNSYKGPQAVDVVVIEKKALRYTGVVKWFNPAKGYGFIQREDGSILFVHYSNIRGSGFRTLKAGQIVEFEIKNGPKGPQAFDVVVTPDDLSEN